MENRNHYKNNSINTDMVRPKTFTDEDILMLLSRKTFMSTNTIALRGKGVGLYSRWESYLKALERLYKKGLVKKEVLNLSDKKNQVIWKLK